MAYIKVENLKYRYPNTKKLALDDLNFEIEKGSFIGIAGANGAGKSTLCQAFNGLVPGFFKGAYGGRVIIDGEETAKVPVSRLCQKVGLVFQNPFNQLSGAKETVFEEIAFGLQNFGVPADEMIKRVNEVMELLDITRIYTMDLLRENIENLKNEGYLDAGTAGCIQKKEIMEFLNTNVGKRMQNAARAKTLYREQPFVLGVDAKEFYPDQKKGEMVLIQGIIDAYFEEDGEIIVLDYKTDRVQTEAELKDRYQEQLRLYTKALEQITRKKVKEQIIYSFTLCKEIHLEGYKND